MLWNDQRGSVALFIEPEQSQAAEYRGHHADDDGRLGVPGHQTAVPVEKSFQSTDDSILTAANWAGLLRFNINFILRLLSTNLAFEVKKVLSLLPGYPLMLLNIVSGKYEVHHFLFCIAQLFVFLSKIFTSEKYLSK